MKKEPRKIEAVVEDFVRGLYTLGFDVDRNMKIYLPRDAARQLISETNSSTMNIDMFFGGYFLNTTAGQIEVDIYDPRGTR